MSNLLKRVLSVVIVLVMVLGMLPLTTLAAESGSVTFDGSAVNKTNQTAMPTWTSAPVTITPAAGGNSNGIKYYTSGAAYRMYPKNTVTISVEAGYEITSVVITTTSSNAMTAALTTVSNASLNISGTTVTLTPIDGTAPVVFGHDPSKTSGNIRFSAIKVNYAEQSAPCAHENTVEVEAVEPTCTEVGYTAAVFCNDCEKYIEGREIVAVTAHTYEAVTEDAYTCQMCVNCGHTKSVTLNKGDVELPIPVANAVGLAKAHNAYTTDKYYVTGKVKTIESTTYGNLYLEDENGNTFYVYGLYSSDGSVRFDAMDPQPAVGDTIIVYGIIGQYSNAAQMKNAWLVDELPEPEEPECQHEYFYPCDPVCMICYEVTNPDAAHNVLHVEAKAATCTENGNIEYWYCEYCGTCWDNAEATGMPLNRMMVVIPAAHTYTDNCDSECDVCGEWRFDAPHNLTEHVEAVVPANCQETGHPEYWVCADCGALFGSNTDTSNQLNPAWITYTGEHVRPEGEPACAVVECELCGELDYGVACDRGDAPECQDAYCINCGEIVIGWGHSYAEGPLCQPGDCQYCGEHFEYIYEHENGAWAPCLEGECSYGCGLTYPATAEHTVEDPCAGGLCTTCYMVTVEPAHTIEHVAESCYNTEYWVCYACESYWADAELVIMTNSKNVIKAEPTHEAEHTAESCYNVEYWYCAACDTYFADADLKQITNSKNVIKAEPTHVLVHKEAVTGDCQTMGNIEHWYCEACGTVWTDAALTQISNHMSVKTGYGEHNFVDGVCSVCGVREPIKWVGTQVQANSNLDMQFALKVSDFEGTSGNYIILTRYYSNGKEAVEVKIEQADWTKSDNFYIVAYSGIAAKEMCDLIEAVVYDAQGNIISEIRTESIETYAKSMLTKDAVIANAEQRTMFVDLLNYGAAAQKFFGYCADMLVNEGLTAEQKGWATQSDVEVSDNRVKGDNFFGTNLSLENVVLMQFAFKVTPVDGMYAEVTYTNYRGVAKTETLAVENNNGYAMVSVNSLAFADYETMVTCTLYNADGTVAGSATDSMASYAARANNELAAALMKFCASAYAFFM